MAQQQRLPFVATPRRQLGRAITHIQKKVLWRTYMSAYSKRLEEMTGTQNLSCDFCEKGMVGGASCHLPSNSHRQWLMWRLKDKHGVEIGDDSSTAADRIEVIDFEQVFENMGMRVVFNHLTGSMREEASNTASSIAGSLRPGESAKTVESDSGAKRRLLEEASNVYLRRECRRLRRRSTA